MLIFRLFVKYSGSYSSDASDACLVSYQLDETKYQTYDLVASTKSSCAWAWGEAGHHGSIWQETAHLMARMSKMRG